MTMVVITHSLAVAQKICNRIAVIDEGRIVEEGFTSDVFSNPQSSITRELIAYDSLSSEPDQGRVPGVARTNECLGDAATTVPTDAIDSSTNSVACIDGQVK